jgi:hypothetical protein
MTHRFLPVALALLPLACTGQVVGTNGSGGTGGTGSPGNPGNPGTPGAPGTGGSPGTPPTTGAVPDNCKGDEVPGPRRLRLLTRTEYASTVADLLGIPAPQVDNLPVESVVDGFDNNASAQVVTSRHMDEYLATSEKLALQALTQSKGKILTCPATTPGCDRMFVTSFGRRAFRRPLADVEVTRYMALFDPGTTGGNFDKGMELVLRAMLASPNFLYRSEVGERAADGTFKLTGYEVATALSYFFWGSMPDDPLLAAASTGALDTPAGVETQARRLLMDPRSRANVGAFFRQWLADAGFQFTNKDLAVYPRFNDRIRNAMIAEQDAFVGYVVFDGPGGYKDLFTADYVFVNDVLAPFYGMTAVAGPTMVKTALPPGERTRGGLLTLGAVVGMHAHSNESSPVRRGAFVRERLLCQTLPQPPQNLNIVPPGLDKSLTTRERFARHSSDPACAICHKLIDGLGFAFERYDGVGAYRTEENGKPISAAGEIRGIEQLNADTLATFDGPIQLGGLLAASPNAQSCLARQLFRYARGGENGEKDACAIKKLQAAFTASGLNVKQLLLETVKQKSFLTRSP